MSKQRRTAVRAIKKGTLLAELMPAVAGLVVAAVLVLVYQHTNPFSPVTSHFAGATQQEQKHLAAMNPRIEIDTDAGRILVELYAEYAASVIPELLALTRSGYYNDNTFMESMPPVGLVIARIGPSVKSFKFDLTPNGLTSRRGSLAISKLQAPRAYLNNLFIGFQHQAQLEDHYIIIGQVVDGLELIEKSPSGARYKIKSFKAVETVQ